MSSQTATQPCANRQKTSIPMNARNTPLRLSTMKVASLSIKLRSSFFSSIYISSFGENQTKSRNREKPVNHCRRMRPAAPAAPFRRRRAKQRRRRVKRARREIGGRGSAARPPASKTERVATGGNGGGRQNIKPPPPSGPKRSRSPSSLCAARPARGVACRLAARPKRPGGGFGRATRGIREP